MKIRSRFVRSQLRGFSLVEILVALAIGMISMVVVLQTYSASEAQNRTTTGSDDAQVAGAIGLFQIERDLTEAGYGMTSSAIIGCSVKLPSGTTVNLAPVTINSSAIPSGDTNTDTLLIAYGNGTGPNEGNYINAVTKTTTYSMQAPSFFLQGDYVIAAGLSVSLTNPPTQAANCNSLLLDTVATGGSTSSPNITVTTGDSTVAGGTLFDVGSSPVVVGYRVMSGALASCSLMALDCSKDANWSVIAGNISSLRAVYGHDGNSGVMNDVLDTWDQTTPSTVCGWIRTSAVSVALVARNSQYTAATGPSSALVYPTPNAPVWVDPAWASGTLKWASSTATSITLDLSGNAGISTGNWKNYRYKLYETTVPLRNVTWEAVNYMRSSSC